MKFRVYFDQVNQTYYDVEVSPVASDLREEAIREAKAMWREDNNPPRVEYVEEIK